MRFSLRQFDAKRTWLSRLEHWLVTPKAAGSTPVVLVENSIELIAAFLLRFPVTRELLLDKGFA